MVLLTDGAANATFGVESDVDPTAGNDIIYPPVDPANFVPNLPFGFCPDGTWIGQGWPLPGGNPNRVFCQDGLVDTHHSLLTEPDQYDADDFARDQAKLVACSATSPAISCQGIFGQNAIVYTIGLGGNILSLDDNPDVPLRKPYGASLLRHIAALGDDGDAAIRHFRAALRVAAASAVSGYPEAHYNLGLLLAERGENEDAIHHYREVVKLLPDFAEAHSGLAFALMSEEEWDDALEHFQQAVRLNPMDPGPIDGLARLLLIHPSPEVRNPRQAIQVARRATQLTQRRDAAALDTLAAAYAEVGLHERAVETAEAALRVAQSEQQADEIGLRLERYRGELAAEPR